MSELKYLQGYPESLVDQVRNLIANQQLKPFLLKKYPCCHDIKTEKALYDFVQELKSDYLKKSAPISKVVYDKKIHAVDHALGQHAFVSRIQGSKLKAKHEIRISSIFREAPLPFLRMIAVHELAHLREKEHNKAFYKPCCHMEPDYHQIEFDMRLFLTQIELSGQIYP